MKFIRSKFLLIACAFVFILFMTNDFGLVNIERTAIIMALGIDYDKEQNEFEITAQIAIPQPSSTASGENNDSLISEKGKTIASAIDKIGINTGWYPMLSFCNLVLLGESVTQLNVIECINYFIRTDKIQDSAYITACDGKAKDFLSSSTPLDSISSFTIQKILGKDIAKLDRIANISIKNFVQMYYSKSKSGYMPLLKKIEVEGSSSSSEQGSSGSSSGGSSGGSSSGSNGTSNKQGKEQYVFDATYTCIFNDGYMVETLTPEETLMFNIKHKNSLDTFISLDEIEIEGKKASAMLGINEYSKKYKFKIENGTPTYCIDLIFFCKFEDANIQVEVSDLNPTADIPEEVLKTAEEKITKTIESLFEKLKKSNCDLFQVEDLLYQHNYSYYKKLSGLTLEKLQLKTTVDCQNEKSTRL